MSDWKPQPQPLTFPDMLTLVLIHLKLSGSIDWSWWLVLMPLLIAWVVTVIVLTARATK